MVRISNEQMDKACAAYARSTGTYPNRAGLRAALHTIDLQESVEADRQAALDNWHITLRGEEHPDTCCRCGSIELHYSETTKADVCKRCGADQ